MNRDTLLTILILYFIFFLPKGNVELGKDEKDSLLLYNDERNKSLELLLNNDYKLGYGNITGFRLSYKDALENKNLSLYPFPDKNYNNFHEDEEYSVLPNQISSKAKEIWNINSNHQLENNFLKNLTGSFRGRFTRKNESLVTIPMPLPSYLENLISQSPYDDHNDDEDEDNGSSIDEYEFYEDDRKVGNLSNINEGVFILEVTSKRSWFNISDADLLETHFEVYLSDDKEDDAHSISLKGLYDPKAGNLFAATSSAKFQSGYTLPHLLLNEINFKAAQEFVRKDYSFLKELNHGKRGLYNSTYQSLKNDLQYSEKCEYISYLNLKPMNLTKTQTDMLDEELIDPIGRPIDKFPNFEIDQGIFYSPDCGIYFEVNNIQGTSRLETISRLRKVVVCAIGLIFGQIYLLIRQMNRTNTPPRLSKISFQTLALMNLVDCAIIMMCIFGSIVLTDLYITFIVGAMMAITLTAIFEIRYMINVHLSQSNESNTDFWTALRGSPREEEDDHDNNNNNNNNGETLPDTNQGNQTAAGQIPTTSLDEERNITLNSYSRLFFSMMFWFFMILNVSVWNKSARIIGEKFTYLIINMYWFPQIFRNIIRGSKTSFSWEFITGTSILRMIPIIYILGYSKNVFHHHQDLPYLIFINAILILSIFILYIQEKYGSRIFIPKRYLPTIYDYHPKLSIDDLENGFGIDLINTKPKINQISENSYEEIYKKDCAICMTTVEIPILVENNDESLLEKKGFGKGDYMITPCKHVFHEDCLENWMRYKLKCPICRNTLPPI